MLKHASVFYQMLPSDGGGIYSLERTPWTEKDQFWEEALPREAGRCRLLKGVQTEESIGQQVLGPGVPGACGRKVRLKWAISILCPNTLTSHFIISLHLRPQLPPSLCFQWRVPAGLF